MTTLIARIKLRGDTLANWTANDPLLADREIGLSTESTVGPDGTNWHKAKVGPGYWSVLPFISIGDSAALQALLDEKAPLDSPTFIGTPSGPTADPGTNTEQLATTAFVGAADDVLQTLLLAAISDAIDALVGGAPGSLDTLSELADALADDADFAATLTALLALKATIASPVFTGIPAAPTAAPGTSTTQIATTAFVAALGALKQAVSADLTAIAALTPTNDDFLQRKIGAWTNRTIAQVKTDLALNNVTNDAQVKIASNGSDFASRSTTQENITGRRELYLTADATGITTTSPANIVGLLMSLAANTRYRVEIEIPYKVDNVAGIFTTYITAPAGTTFTGTRITGIDGGNAQVRGISDTQNAGSATAVATANTPCHISLRMIVTVGSTAGNVQAIGAVNNVSYTATPLAGCNIVVTKLQN